jgi:hypothetical protein
MAALRNVELSKVRFRIETWFGPHPQHQSKFRLVTFAAGALCGLFRAVGFDLGLSRFRLPAISPIQETLEFLSERFGIDRFREIAVEARVIRVESANLRGSGFYLMRWHVLPQTYSIVIRKPFS